MPSHKVWVSFVAYLLPLIIRAQLQTVLTRKIAAGIDDVEEETDGYLYVTSSDIELAYDWEYDTTLRQKIGLRFIDLGIPNGAVIIDAYITFQCDSSSGATSSPRITIWAEDVDNALRPRRDPPGYYFISSKTKTSASVVWSNLGVWLSGQNYETPNLKTIVQEIISRSGWVYGNNILFILEGDGSENTRVAKSYEGDQSGAAELTVIWAESASTQAPTKHPSTLSPTLNPTNNVQTTSRPSFAPSKASTTPRPSLSPTIGPSVSNVQTTSRPSFAPSKASTTPRPSLSPTIPSVSPTALNESDVPREDSTDEIGLEGVLIIAIGSIGAGLSFLGFFIFLGRQCSGNAGQGSIKNDNGFTGYNASFENNKSNIDYNGFSDQNSLRSSYSSIFAPSKLEYSSASSSPPTLPRRPSAIRPSDTSTLASSIPPTLPRRPSAKRSSVSRFSIDRTGVPRMVINNPSFDNDTRF